MESLKRLLGMSPARTPPTPVKTDDVYPVHMLDDTKIFRYTVFAWTLRFNDVLDADKLHTALSRLLEIGDWRKLGGRLRLKENGDLEIHVPRPFTADRPAVFYTHHTLDVSIEDHPLAKTLPKATDGPSIHPGPHGFRPFAAREDAPSKFSDFIYQDMPQLSLHITSFNDATLVSLSWPHTLMDAMGRHALLQSWCLVLAGRESEVPPVLGAREDVICAATGGPAEREEFKLGEKELKGWARIKFILLFVWDLLWNSVETRTIFLPKETMAALRRESEADISAESGGEKSFISDGDVLVAWAARAVSSSLPQSRPITVAQPANARFRIPSLSQRLGVYIQNMVIPVYTYLSAEAARGPLGHTALVNRHHLMGQTTEAQMLACLREFQQRPRQELVPMLLIGDANAVVLNFTNWTRANFFKTADFSPAIVRAGETGPSRINPAGTMVYHHAQTLGPAKAARNMFLVMGKDHGDNYWITGLLLPPTWAKISMDLKEMSQRHNEKDLEC